MRDKKIPPHFVILLVDETHEWSPDIQDRTRCKLSGAYLIDKNRHVYICSTTPSYEAYFLYTVWYNADLTENEVEMAQEDIDEGDSGVSPVQYINASRFSEPKWAYDYGAEEGCYWIDNFRGTGTTQWVDTTGDWETYQDLVDHLLEDAHANHKV